MDKPRIKYSFTVIESNNNNYKIINYCEGELEGDSEMAIKGKLMLVNFEKLEELKNKYKITDSDLSDLLSEAVNRGKVGLKIEHKIPGTSGQYSSTGIAVNVEYHDINVSQQGVSRAISGIRRKIDNEMKGLFNDTLVSLGKEPMFEQGEN